MNPPTPFSAPTFSATPQSTGEVVGSDVTVDSPQHLTFDEMRELPMHLALGFCLEGEQQ